MKAVLRTSMHKDGLMDLSVPLVNQDARLGSHQKEKSNAVIAGKAFQSRQELYSKIHIHLCTSGSESCGIFVFKKMDLAPWGCNGRLA